MHDTAHDFMNKASGAKRRSYTGAKCMHLLKILGTRAGREYGISGKKSLRTGLAWAFSPAVLVGIYILFSM